jgi:glycosyltransferase involved in cell wall biosynthesis
MNFINQVGVLILTYNEAANIERTLSKLRWAKRILIIDSGSSDKTIDIVRRYSQVEVVYRPFDDFANQCNFGLSRIATPWVLSLDADYVLSDDLITELETLTPSKETAGFQARFIYCIYGRRLRASLYPPRVVLYRSERARYRNEGHAHRVTVDGGVRSLDGPILHDDRKPVCYWFSSQQKYARIEANHLLSGAPLQTADRIRRMGWPAPILVFLYTLLVKGCILEGWRGWLYVLQRTLAELAIAIEIVSRRLASNS